MATSNKTAKLLKYDGNSKQTDESNMPSPTIGLLYVTVGISFNDSLNILIVFVILTGDTSKEHII